VDILSFQGLRIEYTCIVKKEVVINSAFYFGNGGMFGPNHQRCFA